MKKLNFILAEIFNFIAFVVVFRLLNTITMGYIVRDSGMDYNELIIVSITVVLLASLLVVYCLPLPIFRNTFGLKVFGVESLNVFKLPSLYVSILVAIQICTYVFSPVLFWGLIIILLIAFIYTNKSEAKDKINIINILIAIIVLIVIFIANSVLDEHITQNDTGYGMYKIDMPTLQGRKKEYGTTDLLEIQNIIDEKLKSDYESEEYTLENPYVVLNPYNRNKLSAYVKIPTDKEVSYKYEVVGKTDDSTFKYNSKSFTKDPVLNVVGLYPNYNNIVNVTLIDKDGNEQKTTVNIDTSNLDIPEDKMTATFDIKDQKAFDKTFNGVIINTEYNAYDINGDLRTYNIAPRTYASDPLKIVNNKLFIYGDRTAYENYTAEGYMYEMNLMGYLTPTMEAPDGLGFHHDMIFHDGKYYVMTGTLEANATTEEKAESMISIYDKDYNFIDTYNFSSLVSEDGLRLYNETPENIHANSIAYSDRLDAFIISFRGISTIAAINDDGTVRWVIDQGGYVSDDIKHLDVTGINNLMSGQHTAYPYKNAKGLKDGEEEILVFDNNSCINKDGKEASRPMAEEETISYKDMSSGNTPCVANDTELLIYKINENNNTAEIITDVPFKDSISMFTGNVQNLNDGYIGVYSSIGTSKYYVVDSEGNLAYTVDLPGSSLVFYRGEMWTNDDLQLIVE